VSDSKLVSSTSHDSADRCWETLEALGELRTDWVHNPKHVRRTLWVYAPLIGALGVLSGYTLYFKIEPIVHGSERALTVFLELLIAAGMVAVLEWVTNVIEYGVTRAVPSRRSVITSIFAVVLFELFVLATHSLADTPGPEIQQGIHDIFQGSWVDFVMFGLVWMIIGAALTRQIAKVIFARSRASTSQAWRGAWRGVVAGLIAAGTVMASVAVFRAIWVLKLIIIEHPKWHSVLGKNPSLSAAARALDYLLDNVRPFGPSVPFGLIIILAAAVSVFYWGWRSNNWKPFGLLAIGTLSILVLPVADANCIKLPLEVFLAWAVPGALMGATVIWLKPDRTLSHSFAVSLLLAALVLTVIKPYYSNFGLWIIPVVILIATSIEIISKKEMQEFWPMAALSIGIVICLLTTPFLLEQANVSSVLGSLNKLAPQGSFSKVIFGDVIVPADHTAPSKLPEQKDEAKDVIIWQLCMTGALSFWVSVGLLIGWSVRKTQDRISPYPDGKKRCFWVKATSETSIEYHDSQHGILPKSDHDLFIRLSAELLTGGIPWGDVSAFSETFENFTPEKVAQMSAAEVCRYMRKTKSLKDVATASTVEAIIENAKRLQTFYGEHGPESTLIRTLQLKAESGPEAAVRFFRSIFRIRESFAVGSFLQATGFLPGAHFPGCWSYR